MKPRKTVNVERVREKVNSMLARPLKHVHRDSKVTLCCLIEDVLMETGNYRGFGFDDPSADPGDDNYYNRRYF